MTKNTNAPLVIVVNGTNRFRMCASFMAWLEKKPWAKNVVKVPQSEAIVQAQGMQKSVVNVDRHGAAAERSARCAARSAFWRACRSRRSS